MGIKVTNNAMITDICTQRLVGLRTLVPAKTEISIDGEPYKLDEVIAVYQASLDTRATVNTKRGELKEALTERHDAEATRRAVDQGLKAWVFNKFGASSKEAHEFGFTSPKKAKSDVTTKFEAVQKSRATREARHTMGPKQKKKVTGTVVVSTEPAAPVVVNVNGTNGASAPSASNGAAPHTA